MPQLTLPMSTRLWLQACCCSACAVAVVAREAVEFFHRRSDEPALAWALGRGTFAAAVALVGQLLLVRIREKEAYEENADSSLTWWEDEGISKLVPLHPEPSGGRKEPLKRFTKEEVAEHNTPNDIWIIIEGRAYDVTRFVAKHPGGVLPIQNMAGRDCTDVFANYHPYKVYKHYLPAYLVGEVSDYVVYPHVADFRRVRQELLRRRLFETDLRYYGKQAAWLSLLLFGSLWLTLAWTSTTAHLAGALTMGIFWQQLAGIGHDLGHNAVTHVFWQDHMLGSFFAALMGISTCWWRKNHNTHHVVCNSVEHDPDIQHMPVVAITPKVFERPFWSSYYVKWISMDACARRLVSYQHWTIYFPVMALARYNLYVQSWIHLFSDSLLHYKRLEIAALSVFALWVVTVAFLLPTWLEMVAWLFVSHAMAGVLHLQIVVSHWAMYTYRGHAYNDEKDEWYITQLKTTLNVATPPLLDWVHIGLQFQIEHHLFPRLPRHNLRKARDLVKAVCQKHGIAYLEPGLFESQKMMWLALRATAMVARTTKRGMSGFYESALWDGLTLTG